MYRSFQWDSLTLDSFPTSHHSGWKCDQIRLLFWVHVFLAMKLGRGGWQHIRNKCLLRMKDTGAQMFHSSVQSLPEVSRLSWPRLLLSLVLYSITAPRWTIRKMSYLIVFMREDLAYNSSSRPFHTTITISAFTPTTPLPRSLWGITSPENLLKSPFLFLLPSWPGSLCG